MKKDFQKWHPIKIIVHNSLKKRPFFHEKNEIFWAIPFTSNLKETKYYCLVNFGIGKKSSAILSQIRLIDAKRLSHKVGVVPADEFRVLTKKLKDLIP